MHSHLGLETTSQPLSASGQSAALSSDGEHVAQIFSYYRRLQNPYKSKTCPMALVSGKPLYKRHKAMFDKFASIANANKLDVEPYLKYCVSCGIDESTLSACIASTTMLDKYEAHVMKVSKLEKIYVHFKQSAINIAKICLDNGLFSAKDFLRMAIEKKLIGKYVFTGEVSMHYFAAIPKFKDIICKLDHFSQDELKPLAEHFDIYHSEVNKAFLLKKNTYVNPIDFTNRVIAAMRKKAAKEKSKSINSLLVCSNGAAGSN